MFGPGICSPETPKHATQFTSGQLREFHVHFSRCGRWGMVESVMEVEKWFPKQLVVKLREPQTV